MGVFRHLRKGEPLSCRKQIGIVAIGKPLELDEQYRDFGQYMIDYFAVQDERYN